MRIGFVSTPFPARPLATEERQFSRAFFHALFTTSFASIRPDEWVWFPEIEKCNLGLLSLCSHLREAGYDCAFYAVQAEEADHEDILRDRIQAALARDLCDFDILCFYSITVNAHLAESLARWARLAKPGIVIGYGGPHATGMGKRLFPTSVFDFVAVGEGESSLLEYVEGRRHGRALPMVEGILCQNHDGAVGSPRRRRCHSPDFSPPAYDLSGAERLPAARVFPIRGCPNSCTFCADPWRGLTARVPLGRVLEEIDLLVRNYGTRYLYLGCEDFLCDHQHARMIANAIHTHFSTIQWTAQCRVQQDLSPGLLWDLAEAGCRALEFGVESADQRILDLVRKRITLEAARDCFSETKKAGLLTHAYWMVGLPGETVETARKTLDTMLAWAHEGLVDTWEYKMFIPYPGTPVYEHPDRFGIRILSGDFSKYHHNGIPVSCTRDLSAEQIYNFYLEGSAKSAELLAAKHGLTGEFNVGANLSSFENMF